MADSDDALMVSILLAEAAQVADGKLNLLGGGVSVIPARPQPLAIAIVVTVPWSRADEVIPWTCELLDAAAVPVIIGDTPVLVNGQVRAGRPTGWPEGDPLNVPVAISFNALPLQAGSRYTWRFAIDGASEDTWAASFGVALDLEEA